MAIVKSNTVGIIGGGQLAAMMAQVAPQLGVRVVLQTPSPEDPATPWVEAVVWGAIADSTATAKLSEQVDVITFENEFIDLSALQILADRGVCFRPHLAALTPLLDKYQQRCCLREMGLPTPHFAKLSTVEAIAAEFGFPLVLKARRHGYDGQGTFIVRDRATLTQLTAPLPPEHWLVEEFVPFERELAVMAARGVGGEVVIYPVVVTEQVEQVCRRVYVPAAITPSLQAQIYTAAQKVLTALDVVGIFGIEFFATADQRLWVNELAPRTHNSGHYTLDACDVSQFEMHLRAVMGQPLPAPKFLTAGAVMVNLLGFEAATSDYQAARSRLAALPQTTVHWYGKTVSRPGRKLGHVTRLLQPDEVEHRQALAAEMEAIWYGSPA